MSIFTKQSRFNKIIFAFKIYLKKKDIGKPKESKRINLCTER